MLAMIERFLKIRSSFQKAAIDLNLQFNIDEHEILLFQEIVKTLKPVAMGAEALGSEKKTLLDAEGIFKFILDELPSAEEDSVYSVFRIQMRERIITRIDQSREASLIEVLKYLKQGTNFNDSENIATGLSKCRNKKLIQKRSINLYKRLYSMETEEQEASSNESSTIPEDEIMGEESLEAKLKKSVSLQKTITPPVRVWKRTFSDDVNHFDRTGERSERVENLCMALASVCPT